MRLTSRSGLTLIELLLSLSIFAAGSVVIFRAFVLSLDRMTHVTTRIQANQILDNQIYDIERTLRAFKSLPLDVDQDTEIEVGGKTIQFQRSVSVGEVEDFIDIFSLNVSISWNESDRAIHLTRASYISDFFSIE